VLVPKAFVHGNPEAAALWEPLFAALRSQGVEDLVALSPPGFGAPVPTGFEPTRLGYRAWLIGELERLGGGVDLVGHDWGAGHVYGVLAEQPDLLRSWAADCAGLVHPDYVWHDLAQAWQTPDVGEQAVAGMFGLPLEQRVATCTSFGMPPGVARKVAAAWGEGMARCVLALYRSAAQPAMAKLGQRLRTTPKRPGLVLIASEDPYTGTPEMCAAVAADLGANTVTLEGEGHWWMFGAAKPAAEALVAHWKAA
jgi:pimeloyl-ACP methyl ester carboxylesterase